VLDDHLLEVPGAFRFVEKDHVLRRHRGFLSEIVRNAPSSGRVEDVRPIADPREQHAADGWQAFPC